MIRHARTHRTSKTSNAVVVYEHVAVLIHLDLADVA